MPELPEVHTTATYLNKAVKNRIIKDVWTDWPKYFRAPKGKIRQSAESFKKKILGRKILSVGRKGKNILFRLSGGYTMLAHQKMTGHFLVGRWHKNGKFKSQNKKLNNVWLGQKWVPVDHKGPLGDDRNRFIRLIFFLSGGEMLALSDLRRFAKIILGKDEEILNLPELQELGPEPIDTKLTSEKFAGIFEFLNRRKINIKQALLSQEFVSGAGNIYADESLWQAKIHPLRLAGKLNRAELSRLYKALRLVLKRAIKSRGSSVDDYRDPSGRAGVYQNAHEVYHKEGKLCSRCGTKIKRIKIGQRSTHFCPHCQK
ncbi:MAG: bifunctional DNA-formamidopyrimidine glycosylase/DNA-(apurinic or apyrimidinic site) lyase [Patescibacteria group bacterium]